MVDGGLYRMAGEKAVTAQDMKPFFDHIVDVSEEGVEYEKYTSVNPPAYEMSGRVLAANLRELATTRRVALLAIIAPCVTGDTSPATEGHARIGLAEEFGIEVALERLRSQDDVDHCYLLVHGPGGDIHSSYHVASALQHTFKEITIFVPRSTSSAGMLLALSGRIVMGTMSSLSPIDAYLPYRNTHISASVAQSAFYRWLENEPQKRGHLQREMADKIDPYIMEDWNERSRIVEEYAHSILMDSSGNHGRDRGSGVDDIPESIFNEPISLDRENARSLSLEVIDAEKYDYTWNIMRLWLSKYLFSKDCRSYIRYVLPADTEEEEEDGTHLPPEREEKTLPSEPGDTEAVETT